MAEEKSRGGTGRRLLTRAGDTMKTATAKLTGKIVEEQVAEEKSRGETGRRLLRRARDTL